MDASLAPAQNGASPTRTENRPRERLVWLDALRGVAALAVVFEHLLDALLPEVRRTASPWFDFGRYGVFVFFIVSGYVIPASLERRGSVREFWIGRAFRLYPLWAVAAAIGLLFALAEVFWGLPDQLSDRPWTSALAHVTMLQDLLGVPNVVNVFWTLSYEMAFYLLVTAMFVAGVHRASAGAALGFGAAALTLGIALPAYLISAAWGAGAVAGVSVLLIAGLAAVLSGRPRLRPWGAAVVAVTALALLALNSRVGAVESFSIMATMFAGTSIYRLRHRGSVHRPMDRVVVILVPALTIMAGVRLAAGWGVPPGHPRLSWGWPAAVAAAWLTFAVVLALRHRAMPRALPWLGVISYSVYLLHQLPLQVVRRLTGDPAPLSVMERAGWAGVIVTMVVVSSAVAYRYVEEPTQRLGRRFARSSRARWPEPGTAGPPARPGRAAVPAPATAGDDQDRSGRPSERPPRKVA
ncbi:acyltransferase family protein [Actinomadura sp. HBU206391]|uniref:acyltransferase family protein n=1 Tax=Actinomadura sp. HBU206391 TaxID=2731692 RepID=UPI00164F3702|nr:acyltransferase [Actinomadura sp. HBU206391]MBC6457863.1 acyltransferase [Actinomadura sp. HBU206391]